MTIPLAATTYDYILALHIVAVVVGFGPTFAYPIVFTVGRRLGPEHLGWFHRVQRSIGQRLINPALVVILLAGIYLASKQHAFGEFYVGWGFAVVVVLGGLVGAFFMPREKRAAELAERDVAAAQGGPVTLSAEYDQLASRLGMVGALSSLLVILTVIIMTVKPGS